MKRRTLLTAGGMAAGAALIPSAIWLAVRSRPSTPSGAGSSDALLDAVCDLVIPETDTPGARAAGVPAFVLLAVAHGLSGVQPDARQRLEEELDARAGARFVDLPPARQADVLSALDSAAFTAGAQPVAGERGSAWPPIKALILIGYYTSEVGGSQELQYVLAPGRFDPDVPLHPGDRAWSSDWVSLS